MVYGIFLAIAKRGKNLNPAKVQINTAAVCGGIIITLISIQFNFHLTPAAQTSIRYGVLFVVSEHLNNAGDMPDDYIRGN